MEKNGAFASPATARARSVLPVPGGPGEKDAARDPAAEPAVLLRAAKEVDDFAQLVLGLVDPRDVLERHAVARRLVSTGPRAPERSEDVLHVPRAPHEEEEESDEENRRPEEQQEALPPWGSRVERLCVDDHALALEELRERGVVGERGNLRSEAGRLLRVLVRLRLLERALDRGPLGRDLLTLPSRTCWRKNGL